MYVNFLTYTDAGPKSNLISIEEHLKSTDGPRFLAELIELLVTEGIITEAQVALAVKYSLKEN